MNDNELFAQYRKTHDTAIRDKIVGKYLYIASVLAKKFVGRGVDYDDLYQVASLALVKGVERFDETLGLQFSTYITPTITGEIKNYFRDHSRLIHLPRKVSELRVGIKNATARFMAEEGRKPTASELAERLGVSEEDILKCAEAGGVISLDAAARDEDSSNMSYHEVLPASDDVYEEIENKDAVRAALAKLDENERKIVEYRFGQELSQVETAKRLGVSQMHVSRLERKILQKLRVILNKSMSE